MLDLLNGNAGIVAAIVPLLIVACGVAWKALSYIYDFRKLKEEKAYVEKNYADEKEAKDRLEHIVAEYQKVGIYREWLFVFHDPAPRNPVCPMCYAQNKLVRMQRYNGAENKHGGQITRFAYYQCGCGCSQHINRESAQMLSEKLEDPELLNIRF